MLGVDGWWPDQGDGLDAPSRLARNRMYCGRQPAVAPRRARVRAAPQRPRRHAARRRVSLVGRCVLDVGNAQDPRAGRDQHGAVGHSVLGHGHRRLRADQRIHRRALRPVVPVRGILPVVPLARAHLEAAPAVGLEHRIARARRDPRAPRPARPIPIRASCTTPPSSRFAARILELRYRLLPYLYSAAREAHDTGMPIMRALWLHYPDDPRGGGAWRSSTCGDATCWWRRSSRRALDPRVSTCRAGRWYDFWDETVHEGGREIEPRRRSGDAPALRPRRRGAAAGSGETVQRRAGR